MHKFSCYKIKLSQIKAVLQYLLQLLHLCGVLGLLQLVDVGLHPAALDQVVVVGGLHARVQGLNLLGLGRYLLLELALKAGVSSLLMDQLLTNLLDLVSVCHG